MIKGRLLQKLILILWLLAYQVMMPSWADLVSPEEQAKAATVKLFVAKNLPDYDLPWQTLRVQNDTGSGVFVKVGQEPYILTSAHVINHASFIEVRKNNTIQKIPATIAWEAHEIDLALLKVDAPNFYDQLTPIALADLAKAGEVVTALGYPLGGDELSTTKGIVSRLEHRYYTHSLKSHLQIQIDTPINPGNSGGPIINQKGELVGIAMQIFTKASNVSYLVPSRLVKHFFDDIQDKRYDGVPHENFLYSSTENTALQKYFNLPQGKSGILIESISDKNMPFQENDILLTLDGINIENNGMVFLPEGKLAFQECIQQKQVGDIVPVELLRNGQIITRQWVLDTQKTNIPMNFNQKPAFYLFGGMVFTPLNRNFLRDFAQSKHAVDIKLAAQIEEYARTHSDKAGFVLLQTILPNEQNAGYFASYSLILSINGTPINDYEHFINLIENTTDELIVLKTFDAQTLVLDKAKAIEADQKIREQYGI